MNGLSLDNHVGNMELVNLAKRRLMKSGFVDSTNPAMTGDPSGGGGGMPMDPSMMGMDPSMMGAAGSGGVSPPPSGLSREEVQAMIQQAMQGVGGSAGGAGGMGEGIKPKIDVNVEIMQMKNLMAKICDALGIQVPAQAMVATPEKLNLMAQGGDPMALDSPTGGVSGGTIQPMGGMPGSGVPGGGEKSGQVKKAYIEQGSAFEAPNLTTSYNQATAIQNILATRKRQIGR